MQTETLHSHRIPLNNAAKFVLGGKAKFTIKNAATENRFTYKVNVAKDNKTLFFVSVLTGSDNETSYTYIGTIRIGLNGIVFQHGRKSRIEETAPSVIYIRRVFNELIAAGKDHAQIEFWHEGRCCKCGRALTVPESIESGIGPECAKRNNHNQIYF